jgi:molybdenum cofactor cytidylyltransferase
LLKDVGARPLPRAKASAPRPRIATVVLAAGRSSRMAPQHKLLVDAGGGKMMVARVVDNLLSGPGRPVIVVTGHRAAEVQAALAGRPVTFVPSPDWDAGLSASLRAGIAAVPDDARAAIVCLGDMPLVTARVLERLVAAYDPDEGRLIVGPTYSGELGNPVLWDRSFFPEMMALTGDRGARGLLDKHAEHLATVAMDDDAVLRDFDTPAQLAELHAS